MMGMKDRVDTKGLGETLEVFKPLPKKESEIEFAPSSNRQDGECLTQDEPLLSLDAIIV